MKNISKKQFQQRVVTAIANRLTEEQIPHEIFIKDDDEKDVVIKIGTLEAGLGIISAYEGLVAQGADLVEVANKTAANCANQIIKIAPQILANSIDIDPSKLTQDDVCLCIKNKEALINDVSWNPLVGNLVKCYMIDFPEYRTQAPNDILEQLKIIPEYFQKKGLENLEHRLFSQDITHASEDNLIVTYHIDNAASLLLFPRFWEILHFEPNGELIICVENQNTIHYTGSRSELGLMLLQEKLTDYCPHLIIVKNKEYEIYDIPLITEIGISEMGVIDPIAAAMKKYSNG